MNNKTDAGKKRRQEMEMLDAMISIYCRGNHHTKEELCPSCESLREYALKRTEKCPFMETKTFFSACTVHCYAPKMQEQIRLVMRYAGPRMLLVHPVLAVRHVMVTLKEKRKGAAHQ